MKEPEAKGVLVVDDNIEFVQLVEQVLSDRGFSNVHHAYNGMECLATLENLGDQIHVIVLGLAMPGMRGFELMQELTARHIFPVGIVMSTGQSFDDNRKEFFSLGSDNVIASAFLSKGESLDVLIQEIRNAVRTVEIKRSERK